MNRRPVVFDRRRFVAIAAGLTVLAASATGAGASNQAAEDSVRRLVEEIVRLVSAGRLDRDRNLRQLAEVIDREADLDRLGRMVLGRHWRTMTAAQQEEYEQLFREMMLRRFAGYLEAYGRDDVEATDGEAFRITGSQEISQGDIVVSSEVHPPDREPLDVKWRLRGEDHPVIIDVVVENVSLLISQRSEFSSVIERDGVDGLLAELRTRVQGSGSV